MNKRRSILAAALALLLCLSLFGCGEMETKAPAGDTTAATTAPGETETDGTTGATAPETNPSEVTVPQGTTQATEATTPGTDSTKPSETKPVTTTPAAGEPALNYAQYMKLSSDEQQKLYDKYFADDPLAFAAWFQRIQAEYEDDTPSIVVTGPVDIGDYIDP